MPLRGRATARNFPKFLDGLRSHIGSSALEGLFLSRDKLLLRADFFVFFRRVNAGEVGSRSRVLACFPCTGATKRGCTKHVLRFHRHVRDDGRAAWRFFSAT
jgi:hypothetical protein